VADVITRCPTGALHFERHDGGSPERAPDTNTVTLIADGPLYVHADVELRAADGDSLLHDTRVALCRCGASENKPLCDGSHTDVEFVAPGTLDPTCSNDGPDPASGELTVTDSRDGPLLFEGSFELRGADAGTTRRRSDDALCRGGASENKPFCDGSHASVGFSSEAGE
jgi:CDGSH-type Zn-finger protein